MSEEARNEPDVAFRRFADPALPFGLWVRRRRQTDSELGEQFAALCREGRNGFSRNVAAIVLSLFLFYEAWLPLVRQAASDY
jgi:hypothetical protein